MNTGYTPVQGRGFVRPENQNLQNFAEIIPVISGLIGGSETNIVNARALQMFDDDEKGVNLTYTPDGNQNMSIISESVFYKLIKTKSAPLPERPCEQLTYCAKNWISAGELYQPCGEAPQLPDNRQNKGHPLRWPLDTSYTLSPTHEHNQQCHICGWWANAISLVQFVAGYYCNERLGSAVLFKELLIGQKHMARNLSDSCFPKILFLRRHFPIKSVIIRTISECTILYRSLCCPA
ncbi:hypothetical protein QT321_05310 [Escherichia coli]|nr:hypothetical protein [Escherichia coli]MDM4928033.1 hypothetical protein [Escherichia coli]